MVKYRWEMEDIDDCVIVTRLVDSGEEAEGGGTLLKVRRISRPDGFGAIAEIRASLDVLEKELKNAETPENLRKPSQKDIEKKLRA